MFVLVSWADAGASAAVPSVELKEPDNFRQLHVQLDGVDDSEADGALRAEVFGQVEGDHAWLEIDALRRAGTDSEAWRSGFDAMLDYAQAQGWMDNARTRVRAHLARPE